MLPVFPKRMMRRLSMPRLLLVAALMLASCEPLSHLPFLKPSPYVAKTADEFEAEALLAAVPNAPAVAKRLAKIDVMSPEDLVTNEPVTHVIAMYELPGVHRSTIDALAVTADGMTAFSGSDEGAVVQTTIATSAHDAEQNGALQTSSRVLLQGSEPILAMSLSSDETKLAISQNSRVYIFDLVDQKIINLLSRVEGRVTALGWDPRGEFLVLGAADGGVYVWNITAGRAAGRDSRNALEFYPGGISPIVSIVFHPQGRVFFAAERDGVVSLWRLLRTEREIGLRDDLADIDREQKGTERKIVANIGGIIHDGWLEPRGQYYYVAADDGKLYRWKVRGIKSNPPLEVARGALFAIGGANLWMPTKSTGAQESTSNLTLLFVTGRAQGLSIWGVPDPVSGAPDEAPQQQEECLLGRTALFANEVTTVKMGGDHKTLWAIGKTGSLLIFNVGDYINRQDIQTKLKNCITLRAANGSSQR